MKVRFLVVITYTIIYSCAICAQTSNYASYLSKAMEKLEAGDCESAQKFYNVYKDLSGTSKPSVQVLIDDCKKDKEGKYTIGQKITVNDKVYTIAYLNESGQHGFAVYDAGIGDIHYPHSDYRIAEQRIPSWDELNIIYKNNALIGLTGEYWSRTPSDKYELTGEGSSYYEILLALDFFSGKTMHIDCRNKSGILLLYRF